MTHEEIIKLIKAHKEGKQFDYRNDSECVWVKLTDDVSLQGLMDILSYSAKREVRVRHEPRRWWVVITCHQGKHLYTHLSDAQVEAHKWDIEPIEVMEVLKP